MKIKLYSCRQFGFRNVDRRFHLGVNYLKTNCNADIEIVYDMSDLTDCDMIGLSAFVTSLDEAFAILKSTDIPVVIGGPVTLWDELEKYDFKHIVKGEGEIAFQSIIDGNEIDKIVSKPLIENIDILNFPHRDPTYNKEYTVAQSSRGCLFNCYFCGAHKFWKKMRFHSIGYCMEEARFILKELPHLKKLRYVDNLFVSSKERFIEFHDAWMREGFDKRVSTFAGTVRADMVTEETIKLMSDINFREPYIGLESASERVLKLINKQTTVEDNQRCIDLFNSIGVKPIVYMMNCLPGENLKDLQKNEKFIKKNITKASFDYQRFVPFPGVDFYKGEPFEESVKKSKLNWDRK